MIKCTLKNKTLEIKFTGRLDSANCLVLEREIIAKLHEQVYNKIAFDLHDVDYIASAFLRICLTTAQEIGNDNFAIMNTQPQVKKIFAIAGLNKLFSVS